ITRDIAERFNHTFGETFKLPEPYILKDVAVVPGTDGRKMSKSYGNTIDLFDDPKVITKKCKRLVTDSRPPEEPGDPSKLGEFGLFQLFRLFAAPEEWEEIKRQYLQGGLGYGTVKVRLADLIIERFAEARERRAELLAHP